MLQRKHSGRCSFLRVPFFFLGVPLPFGMRDSLVNRGFIFMTSKDEKVGKFPPYSFCTICPMSRGRALSSESGWTPMKRRITNTGSQKIIGKFVSRKNSVFVRTSSEHRRLTIDRDGNYCDELGCVFSGRVWWESQLERDLRNFSG